MPGLICCPSVYQPSAAVVAVPHILESPDALPSLLVYYYRDKFFGR